MASGVAALMLQANPSLSPDDVKCGMMATATAAMRANGNSAYSVFQQGAGLVRAEAAVNEGPTGCANTGLDINADLAGTQHFAGMAAQLPDGSYYLANIWGPGTLWTGTVAGTKGYPWANGFPWSNGYPWANGYPWTDQEDAPDSTMATEATTGTDATLVGRSMKSEHSMTPGQESKPRKYRRVPGRVLKSTRSRIEVVKPAPQQ